MLHMSQQLINSNIYVPAAPLITNIKCTLS